MKIKKINPWQLISFFIVGLLVLQYFNIKNVVVVKPVNAYEILEEMYCPCGCGENLNDCEMSSAQKIKNEVLAITSTFDSEELFRKKITELYGKKIWDKGKGHVKPQYNDLVKSKVVEITPKEWDFGTISMANGKITKTFTIKNISNQPVVVSSLDSSCMCTKGSISYDGKNSPFIGMVHGKSDVSPQWTAKVDPGKSAQYTIQFDPAFHGRSGLGDIIRYGRIMFSSPNQGKIDITIRAKVVE